MDFVVGHDIMPLSGGKFRPSDKMVRAEVVTVIYRAFTGAPLSATAIPVNSTGLVDVETSEYYTGAVNWAVAEGIASGVANPDGSKTHFMPYADAPREQVVCMLYNAVDKLWRKRMPVSSLSSFRDASLVSSWASTAMGWAVSIGAVTGSDGYLRPADTIKREELAKMVAEVVLWADPQRAYTNMILSPSTYSSGWVCYDYSTGGISYYKKPSVPLSAMGIHVSDPEEEPPSYDGGGTSAWAPPSMPSEDDIALQAVMGSDDRVRVSNTRTYPYNAIGYLDLKAPWKGDDDRGTASLISRTAAVTVAHNVVNVPSGRRYAAATLKLGKSEGVEPYSALSAAYAFIPYEFYANPSYGSESDLALMIFPSLLTRGYNYLGYGYNTNGYDSGKAFCISGYPMVVYVNGSEEVSTSQWYGEATGLKNLDESRFMHYIDTTIGSSGSPLYNPSGFSVIGVHSATSENSSFNIATRITRDYYDVLCSARVNGESR